MVEIYALTSRHIDAKKGEELPAQLRQIKLFSTFVGHGIGTIDFTEKITEFSDEEYEKILQNSGEYTKFKIGNLSSYFEIEIFEEHAKKLIKDMCDCKLKEILKNLNGRFLVLRKDFKGI